MACAPRGTLTKTPFLTSPPDLSVYPTQPRYLLVLGATLGVPIETVTSFRSRPLLEGAQAPAVRKILGRDTHWRPLALATLASLSQPGSAWASGLPAASPPGREAQRLPLEPTPAPPTFQLLLASLVSTRASSDPAALSRRQRRHSCHQAWGYVSPVRLGARRSTALPIRVRRAGRDGP